MVLLCVEVPLSLPINIASKEITITNRAENTYKPTVESGLYSSPAVGKNIAKTTPYITESAKPTKFTTLNAFLLTIEVIKAVKA